MTVEKLLSLIPVESFAILAAETKVDYQVKKLTGASVFKLVLFSMLNSDKPSLRVMETFLSSAKFKQFSDADAVSAKYNSIRDRICNINATYFEQLFESIFALYNKELSEEKAIAKADSTYVSISAKLVTWSMFNGTKADKQKLKQIKYSVNLKGSLPCHVKIYNDKAFVSEDLALGTLINATGNALQESVVVFDRGLQSRKAFDDFNFKDILFVGRANPKCRCDVQKNNALPGKPKDATVTITKDTVGLLSSKHEKHTQHSYCVITGKIDSTEEDICFVTNLIEENPYEIAAIYKKRWEIEQFFKFIKQHLNVKHLVSRNENGIRVMLYMTMITAILIITFKKLNKISTFKIAKLKFEIELDNYLIQQIVVLCGGNPKNAQYLWNTG